jgi:hypothetical protein
MCIRQFGSPRLKNPVPSIGSRIHPIGLAELTKFLAEEGIFGPGLRQRLPKQALDVNSG